MLHIYVISNSCYSFPFSLTFFSPSKLFQKSSLIMRAQQKAYQNVPICFLLGSLTRFSPTHQLFSSPKFYSQLPSFQQINGNTLEVMWLQSCVCFLPALNSSATFGFFLPCSHAQTDSILISKDDHPPMSQITVHSTATHIYTLPHTSILSLKSILPSIFEERLQLDV